MTITINGEATDLPDGSTLRHLVGTLGLPETGIAVAVDGTVVPRVHWNDALAAGVSVEVVTAVQGG